MENTNLEIITYPHYDKLPKQLKHNLNIMRANVVEVFDETDYETCLLYTSPSPRD